MLTIQDQMWHKIYENMPESKRTAIDTAWREARLSLSVYGLHTSNADPAEALVAAITRYVVESEKS